MSFTAGDRVRILEGPFVGFEGQISEIRQAPETLVVAVRVLGQPTSVDLLPSQVESPDSGDEESAAPVREPSHPRRGGSASASADPD